MITVTQQLIDFSEAYAPEKLFGPPTKSGIGGKTTHSYNVHSIGMELPRSSDINPVALAVYLKAHDVGRHFQWIQLGNFNDRVRDHRDYGHDMIEEAIANGQLLRSDPGVVALDYVVTYHGKPGWEEVVPEEYKEYVQIVSTADNIENGCIGALGYLEDEKSRDDKGFIAKDKNLDQRQLNPELLGYLERGQKFNKNELCHTYAEYFVFAAMLAVNVCLMEDGTGEYAKEIMKGMWYSYTDEEGVEHQLDAVEGYCHIFERHLLTEDAEKACAMMREKCR